jgi:C4-dicarboxylate-binding protein DctP
MQEATRYAASISDAENAAALDAIRASGKTEVHTLTAAERQAWVDALAPVVQEMKDVIGSQLIADIQQTIRTSDQHVSH